MEDLTILIISHERIENIKNNNLELSKEEAHYLNKVKFGDKRVFIIKGKVKGAIKRVPRAGSNLSNISQGGTAFKTGLSKKELKISSLISKSLIKDKIYFAGIDLIDGYLIGDINVTSPTGLPQFKDLTGKNLAKDFWDGLGLK